MDETLRLVESLEETIQNKTNTKGFNKYGLKCIETNWNVLKRIETGWQIVVGYKTNTIQNKTKTYLQTGIETIRYDDLYRLVLVNIKCIDLLKTNIQNKMKRVGPG